MKLFLRFYLRDGFQWKPIARVGRPCGYLCWGWMLLGYERTVRSFVFEFKIDWNLP